MATFSSTTQTASSPLRTPSTVASTHPSTASSIVDSTKPTPRCTSPFCSINCPHDRGLYLHSCRIAMSPGARRIFAPSVPPSDVLAAYERCIRNDGTKSDVEMWVTFHELHVEPLLENTNSVWIAPAPTTWRNDDFQVDECADPSDVEADGAAEVCRHPFGFFNPPERVWEAHRKLALGHGGSEDQELVDGFAVKNAYYGDGLGEQKKPSRRFKVRRPRHSASLAKQCRIQNESKSK